MLIQYIHAGEDGKQYFIAWNTTNWILVNEDEKNKYLVKSMRIREVKQNYIHYTKLCTVHITNKPIYRL